MINEKEIPLKIEKFSEDEDREFSIYSKSEIKTILRTIYSRNDRVALYYNEGTRFVLTMLLTMAEDGIWIDPPSATLDKRNLLSSNEITFVSTYHQAKVQFTTMDVQPGFYDGNDAIFIEFPERLVRLQRRDYYRLNSGTRNQLKCVFKPTINLRHFRHEAAIMDISVGGMSLMSPETALNLTPGLTYQNCEVQLPNIGTFITTVEVKSEFEVIGRNGKKVRRAGCAFVKPDGYATSLLQRYVTQMQLSA